MWRGRKGNGVGVEEKTCTSFALLFLFVSPSFRDSKNISGTDSPPKQVLNAKELAHRIQENMQRRSKEREQAEATVQQQRKVRQDLRTREIMQVRRKLLGKAAGPRAAALMRRGLVKGMRPFNIASGWSEVVGTQNVKKRERYLGLPGVSPVSERKKRVGLPGVPFPRWRPDPVQAENGLKENRIKRHGELSPLKFQPQASLETVLPGLRSPGLPGSMY